MDKKKTPLLGMTLLELQDLVIGLGLPKFTARQIAAWLYVKKVRMTRIRITGCARLTG